MDPELHIPLPKGFNRDYGIVGIDSERLRIALNEVAKYVAIDTVRRLLLRGRIKRSELGRKWLELVQDLLKAWIHEISIQLIEQSTVSLVKIGKHIHSWFNGVPSSYK